MGQGLQGPGVTLGLFWVSPLVLPLEPRSLRTPGSTPFPSPRSTRKSALAPRKQSRPTRHFIIPCHLCSFSAAIFLTPFREPSSRARSSSISSSLFLLVLCERNLWLLRLHLTESHVFLDFEVLNVRRQLDDRSCAPTISLTTASPSATSKMEPRFTHPYAHSQPVPPPLRTPDEHRFPAIPPPPYSSQSPLAPREPPRREDPFYPRRPPFESHAPSPTRPEPSPSYVQPPPSYPSNPYASTSVPNGHGHGHTRNGYALGPPYEQKRRDVPEQGGEAGMWNTFHFVCQAAHFLDLDYDTIFGHH